MKAARKHHDITSSQLQASAIRSSEVEVRRKLRRIFSHQFRRYQATEEAVMAATERLNTIKKHLQGSDPGDSGAGDGSNATENGSCPAASFSAQTTIPRRRQDLLKWNGWGYKDSKFVVDGTTHHVSFTGDRYKIGNKTLPHFKSWVESALGVDLSVLLPAKQPPSDQDLPSPVVNEAFVDAVRRQGIVYSSDGQDRLFRAHGTLPTPAPLSL
ncbi:hypothetical protein ISCGN_021072 [Ixodes scapularis]